MDLRMERKSLGLTQSDVAAQTGVSQSRLSLAELGKVQLSPEELNCVNELFLSAAIKLLLRFENRFTRPKPKPASAPKEN